MNTLEKQLAHSKKAGSKKDQEIARLKAQLEDREGERRTHFPNGSPGNSDVESEDEVGGNAADSVNISFMFLHANSTFNMVSDYACTSIHSCRVWPAAQTST